jgi:8-oxo-dGTP diphosphatase
MTSQLSENKHFTTSSFVVNKDKTKALFVFHKKIKRWIYPGGHLEVNEIPDEAVLRELKEETGIDGKIISQNPVDLKDCHEAQLATPYCVLMMKIKGSSKSEAHSHLDLVYLIEADSDELLSSEDNSEAKWFTKNEIEDIDTFKSLKQIARKVLDGK